MKPISRRTVLRGMGASLALPWLDAMQPVFAGAAPAIKSAPVRMAFIYVPNGKHLPDWFPKHEGVLVDLPPTLQPLAFARDELLTFSGLTHNNARSNGDRPDCDHARGSATFLTGVQAFRGRGMRVGVSVDQFAASYIGQETRFPSLELGCQPFRAGGGSGYSSAYKSNVSWKTPTTPAPYENNPKLVFDRLFTTGDAKQAQRTLGERDFYRKSILDYVMTDAASIQKSVGRADQQKLDQYLTGIREVERRIERANGPVHVSESQFARPNGIPQDFGEHVRLLGDLIVLAFQTDTTRIASMILAEEANNRAYPFLGISDGHHDISHHGGEPEKHRKLKLIDRYHISLLAHIVEKMKATADGDGTLLDHSMLLYGSGLSDGDRHDHGNLPVIVVGKGGGLKTGRHIQCRSETPMSNLFVSMLHQAGIPAERFGDSTGPLQGLTA